jgi:GH15 family glucan-1,4-alpha-glucosidase
VPDQPPISAYGLIGDGRTAALCSDEGSIDWLCVPRFDSDPIFGKLVGGPDSGSFLVTVDGIRDTSRRYRGESATIETTWTTEHGRASLTEGMVADVSTRLLPRSMLVRRLTCTAGRVRGRVRFDPRERLCGPQPRLERRSGALVCTWRSMAVALESSPDLQLEPGRDREVDLSAGESITLVMSVADREPLVFVSADLAWSLLEETDAWWHRWSSMLEYEGPGRERVVRSLLTLRLLTYTPSGAPVAAPTTSLPEAIGSGRNWDYRFAWPRDASIGLAAFLLLGHVEEAQSFMHWLLHASRMSRPKLDVLYTLDGRLGTDETEIGSAPGYADSRPVRIGNGASTQHQLDVYGWVVDAASLLEGAGHRLQPETWRAVSGFVDFVADRWRLPDAGIWELRGEPRHHVHSKLMGWLALDRALRLSGSHRTRGARVALWRKQRDALAVEVRERGFSGSRNSYTRSYGSEDLDASVLLLPVLEFEEPGSPRLAGTVDAIRSELGAGGGLLYRYPPGTDDLEGEEGAFLPCSFWLVQALARTGRREEGSELFETVCGFGNDLGLLPEEIDPRTGAHLGNFPQALSHAGLIQAALALAEPTLSEGLGTPRARSRRPRAQRA